MQTTLKICLGLIVVIGLTAFGLISTCLAKRNPSPAAVIGAAPDHQADPLLYDDALPQS